MGSRWPGIRLVGSGAWLFCVLVGCTTKSSGTSAVRPVGDGGSSSGGSSSGGSGVLPGAGDTSLCVANSCGGGDRGMPKPAGCGDGMLADDEACDDGNLVSGTAAAQTA